MRKKKTKLLCMAAIFTALVFVVTAYLHIPTNNGYIHVGDGLIYLAACMLPWPYALAVGACGALLADCLTGFAIWAPCSVIIKALIALLFTSKNNKLLCMRNRIALFPAAVINVGGYYLYESARYGNWIAPLTGIPASLTQSVTSSILFIVLGITFDKTNLKNKLNGGL
jgi:uncharacterized repeat protein (TIGR04002 family)